MFSYSHLFISFNSFYGIVMYDELKGTFLLWNISNGNLFCCCEWCKFQSLSLFFIDLVEVSKLRDEYPSLSLV